MNLVEVYGSSMTATQSGTANGNGPELSIDQDDATANETSPLDGIHWLEIDLASNYLVQEIRVLQLATGSLPNAVAVLYDDGQQVAQTNLVDVGSTQISSVVEPAVICDKIRVQAPGAIRVAEIEVVGTDELPPVSEPSSSGGGSSGGFDLGQVMQQASGIIDKLREVAKKREGQHEAKQERIKTKEFDDDVKNKVPIDGSKTQGHGGGPEGKGWDGKGYKLGVTDVKDKEDETKKDELAKPSEAESSA